MVLDVIGCDVGTEAVEEVPDAFEVVQLLSVVEVMFDKTDVTAVDAVVLVIPVLLGTVEVIVVREHKM